MAQGIYEKKKVALEKVLEKKRQVGSFFFCELIFQVEVEWEKAKVDIAAVALETEDHTKKILALEGQKTALGRQEATHNVC